MRKYKKKLKDELYDIVCDICGKTCIIEQDVTMAEFATLEAIWGYYSRKDETRYSCEMCEDCFDKVSSFIDKLKNENSIR